MIYLYIKWKKNIRINTKTIHPTPFYITNKLIDTSLKELEDYYNSHKEAIQEKDIKIDIFDFNKDNLKTEIKNIIKTTMLR
jgi:hypothetical protein